MGDHGIVSEGRTNECGSIASNFPGSLVGDGQRPTSPSTATTSSAPAAMEVTGDGKMAEDRSLSGASSEPAVPLQGGAGEPGGSSLVSKMMMMMTGGDTHMMPGTSAVPDMTSILKGGMPFPDMASVMSGGGMSAMMNPGMMKGGPMQMAKIFDCIIDMSLARADSDDSEDDEEGATVEIPCQYCHRCFSSEMTLKTHILVAHEHEDDSALNLNQLTINGNGRSPKDRSQRNRKHSQDIEVFASGISAKSSGQNSSSESVPMCADFSAAECVRGVKRGRTESKDMENVEKGGASGMDDAAGEEHHQTQTSHPEPGALPHVFKTSASKDHDQGISQQKSSNYPMGFPSQSKPKKTKTKRFIQKSGSEDGDKCQNEDSSAPMSFRPAEEVAGAKEGGSGEGCTKEGWAADRWAVDRTRAVAGPQAAAAAGPEQAGDSPISARRSLRSNTSNF